MPRCLLFRSVVVVVSVAVCGHALAETVVVELSVEGAEVSVDGIVVDPSAPQRLVLDLEPGTHNIKAKHDGFEPFRTQFEVVEGKEMRVEVFLEIEQPSRVARPIRVAVHEASSGEGIEQRVGSVVSEALLAEVRKRQGISAIGMGEIKEMLSFEAQRQLIGCGDNSCLAEIAGALGVDELVTCALSRVGDSHVIVVRRLDIVAARPKGAFEKRLVAETGEEFLAAIGPAINDLFGDHPLRRGKTAGVSLALAAAIDPPPLPRWVFFGTAAATGGVALAGGYFGLVFRDSQAQYDRQLQSATTNPASGSDLVQLEARMKIRARNANIGFAVAGGLLLVAVVEALLTDWNDVGAAFDEKDGPIADVFIVPGALVVTLW